MNIYVEQKPGIHRSIRNLFIIGLVGFILAASGVIWILVEFTQQTALLTSKVALYIGSWTNKHDPNFSISKIVINNNGLANNNALNIVVHVSGNCNVDSTLPCDMGTYNQEFTSEPLTVYLAFTDSNGTGDNWPLTMTLSNTSGTLLNVVVNNSPGIFVKT